MAFSATAFTYFSPQALSRPRRFSKSRSAKPKLRTDTSSRKLPPTPLTSSPGDDATSYTRLPPKDDFVLSSLSHLYQSPTEVKLSDSTLKRDVISKPSSAENEVGEFDVEESDDESGFDYGKFELFEVSSDVDFEDGEDDDEDFNGDEGLGFRGAESESMIDGEEIEDEEGKSKEKGVPAVMRCFDRAKIYVQAGDGGNGVVAFRREKFVPFGGPSGGDGGRGGNVYFEVDGAMNSLLPFRKNIHFRAPRGQHGQGSKMNGAKGEDVVVKVPPGTVIREAGSDGMEGELLLELMHPGQRALLLPGGRGGRGNASFKSGTNKVPKIAENGEAGLDM